MVWCVRIYRTGKDPETRVFDSEDAAEYFAAAMRKCPEWFVQCWEM